MNIVWGLLITAGAIAVTVSAMLLVRRRAPEGSYFSDGDRASGVFGVLATGFSVLLGFIIFLAFTSYDESRSGAETEALVVAQQVENAQFFTSAVREELTGELVCYARSVVNGEWDRMEAGTLGDHINPWGVELFRTLQDVEPTSASEQSAYDKWLEQTSAREKARLDRIHGAVGVIPTPLWIVLFIVSVVIFAYMLFFADSGERAKTQALMMGSVTAVIVLMLLLLSSLDNPFRSGVGGLRPVAMERTLDIVDQSLRAVGSDVRIPCDAEGNPAE
jgi:ABC-type multidrug transport system fused ATPase/permease subunit